MNTTHRALFAVVASLALFGPALSSEPDPKEEPMEKDVDIWMKRKSNLSHRVMEGLTEGDFEKIRKAAVTMNVLSYFEGRAKSDSDDYKRQLGLFDFANRELIRSAKAKNLEGATLAFNQLTISCVSCHKALRDGAAKE